MLTMYTKGMELDISIRFDQKSKHLNSDIL